jgi:hypothetical protein
LSLYCPFLVVTERLCLHCLCIVHSWLSLHVYVYIVSVLSILGCHWTFMFTLSLYCPFLVVAERLCLHCLCIVHSWLSLNVYDYIVSVLSILGCHLRDNQEWTIQRQCKHKRSVTTKNGQYRDNVNINVQWQPRMDNTETM